jgi:two-component system, NtrC family, response regulator GlrR
LSQSIPPPVPRSRPRLTWTDAAGTHQLDLRDRRTAGSAVHCELVIADRAVSRVHCELAAEIDGLWLRDLGSRNGSYVNGVKVTEARIPSGSIIRLGTTDISVNYDAPTPPEELWAEPMFAGLIGYSAPMREVFAQIAVLAKSDASVIIEGEPGTGKKALARALHDQSDRAGQPFVIVECGALPDPERAADWLEELLSSAEGGTLLLDEPSELPLTLQRELTPPLDAKAFRVLVTTNSDLRRLLNQGAFRESLYFRLAGATVRVPPLRDRMGDFVPLLERFLDGHLDLVTPQLLADLERLPWTGNVRELRVYAERMKSGEIDRAAAAAAVAASEWEGRRAPSDQDYGTMEAPALIQPPPSSPETGATPPAESSGLPPVVEPWFTIGFKEFREKWIDLGEREYLRRLMVRTNRSSGTAAREAGLERTYLYRLLKKHGV